MSSTSDFTLIEELQCGAGYRTFSGPDKNDLDNIWEYITLEFARNMGIKDASRQVILNLDAYPDLSKKFSSLSVFDRTLERTHANKMLIQPWISRICNELKMFPYDAYNLGYPSFTWRVVRSGSINDLRDVHRDQWFRLAFKECDDNRLVSGGRIIDRSLPETIQTVKVWLAVNVVPGEAGLLVAGGSQMREKPGFRVTDRDGFKKPLVINEEVDRKAFELAYTKSGDCVVFGERLMHGGAPTLSKTSRVSLEFALASKNQDLYNVFEL